MPTRYYTVPEIADITRFGTETVWRKCRENQWPHLKMGRNYRFTEADRQEIENLMKPKPAQKKAARTAKQRFKENLG